MQVNCKEAEKWGVEVSSANWRGSVSVSIMIAGLESFELGAVVILERSLLIPHGEDVAGTK